MPAVPFSSLDAAAFSRALAQIAENPDDLADVYLERREEVDLAPEDEGPGLRVWREEGLAVRLVRDGHTWLASRDTLDSRLFSDALRQVARALPSAAYPEPRLQVAPWQRDPDTAEVQAFPSAIQRALRQRHVAFPLRLSVRRHRRWLQVIGPHLVPAPQQESFYSCVCELPWSRFGTLLPELGDAGVETFTAQLLGYFRSRQATPPDTCRGVVVLDAGATAVLLHEAVAHALEADTLALGGKPDAAIGLRIGAEGLNVLDDPAAAPEGVRRDTDDEGIQVNRRWLLRDGIVEQPLADGAWARSWDGLQPGCGRRSHRHLPPVPRSSHLELLPGDYFLEDLLHDADGGLFVTEASRGNLDPLTGAFTLHLPYARRIRGGEIADAVGPCSLHGSVSDLLSLVRGIGAETRSAGAGWCAKGGVKLPVWARAPAIRLEGVEVTP